MDLSFGFLSQLTPREQEILELVANGYEDKAIARQLQISVLTVHTHVRNLFAGLGVRNRTQAASMYWQSIAGSRSEKDT